jgi:molybdopterin/thiamine biosynthesis adenylyltransferase
MQRPWWKAYPGRLRRELRELRRGGIEYTADKSAFRNGSLQLELKVRHDGVVHPLVARYPETFPFFRVDVEAPELSLAIHQNPFSKSLCLIGRRTENWTPSDTLAWLIGEQLPRLLKAANAIDRSATVDIEENQGEPLTTFYPFLPRSSVLVDSAWHIPQECGGGWLHIGVRSLRSQFVRAAVLKVLDARRNVIATAEPSIKALYKKKRIWIRWTRHSDFIVSEDPDKFFDHIATNDPSVRQFSWHRSKGTSLDLTGVLLREEVQRDRHGDTWMFVLRETFSKRRGLPRVDPGRTKLVQSQRAGRSDLTARTPETVFLQKKKVSVVGLGCIGAPVAVELSKAGCGTLVLVDSDLTEPGQTIRWPVGLQLAGQNKAAGLATFIRENWPYTTVEPLTTKVGISIPLDEHIVSEADLVLDCSAEEGVQRYLAKVCREQSKTLILASTTPGARGGIVVRFRSDPEQFCFQCWELYQQEGMVPNPPEDAGGRIQPVGCADPTFTGTGFDATEVSLMATRTATGELGRNEVAAYPDCWWNVAVLSLRNGDQIIPPRWEVLFLRPHRLCKERHS